MISGFSTNFSITMKLPTKYLISKHLLLLFAEMPRPAVRIMIYITMIHDPTKEIYILNVTNYRDTIKKEIVPSEFSRGLAYLKKKGVIKGAGSPALYYLNTKWFDFIPQSEVPVKKTGAQLVDNDL